MPKKHVEVIVGSSQHHRKTIALPGVRKVDPIPVNAQGAGWKDTFAVYVVKDKEFVVERVDTQAGWGQNLILRAAVKEGPSKRPKKQVVVMVGAHNEHRKVIQLRGVRSVDATPVNPQQPSWTDRFFVQVVKDKEFIVERVDVRAGWGQPLELRAFVAEEEQKFVPQPFPTPVPQPFVPSPQPFVPSPQPFVPSPQPFQPPGPQPPFPGQPGFPQPFPTPQPQLAWPGQGAPWREIPGAAVCVGVDAWGTMICANSGGMIYEKKISDKDWGLLDNNFGCTSIARGHDGSTWCVNREQHIFRRHEGAWHRMPGAAVFVTVGSHDQVVVLDHAGLIFKWQPMSSQWVQIDGRGSTASIGHDGCLVVCDQQGETYRRDGATWTKLPINARLPAVASWNLMYITTKAGEVFHSGDGGTQWKPVNFNLSHISACRGQIAGTNAQQKIFHLVYQG